MPVVGYLGDDSVDLGVLKPRPVLCHRVVLGNEARYTKKTGTEILSGILEETPVPPQKERMFHENGGK